MQHLSVQMQQLQRQFGQLCKEMLGIQSVMSQIAAQIQSAEGMSPGIPSYRASDGAQGLPSGPSPAHPKPGGNMQPQVSPYGSRIRESPYGNSGFVGMIPTVQTVGIGVESTMPTYMAAVIPSSGQSNEPGSSLTDAHVTTTSPMSSTTTVSVGRQSEHSAYGRDFQ